MTFDPPLFLIGTIFGGTVAFAVQQWRISRIYAEHRDVCNGFKAKFESLTADFNRMSDRYHGLSDRGRTRRFYETADALDHERRETARRVPKADGYVGAGRPVIGTPPSPRSVMGERPSSSDDSFVLGMMVGGVIASGSEPAKAADTCKPVTIESRSSDSHHSAPSYDSGSYDSGSSSSSSSDSGSSGGGGD